MSVVEVNRRVESGRKRSKAQLACEKFSTREGAVFGCDDRGQEFGGELKEKERCLSVEGTCPVRKVRCTLCDLIQS